jgi:hypothetical protein
MFTFWFELVPARSSADTVSACHFMRSAEEQVA